MVLRFRVLGVEFGCEGSLAFVCQSSGRWTGLQGGPGRRQTDGGRLMKEGGAARPSAGGG
jgi:hypothetical protein